jgi:hypothetical protein
MASFKNVKDTYTINVGTDANGVYNGSGNLIINAQTTFEGNVTYTVPATTTSAFFTAAANNTGSITDMGLLGQTGPTTYAGFRFDTTVNAWQTSSSVYANGAPISDYANIGSTPAGDSTDIQFNNNGIFAGNANLTFNILNSQIRINGSEAFGNIGTVPGNIANAVVLYSNAVGQGGTGLYFTSAARNGELVSRRNAIIYGIIF